MIDGGVVGGSGDERGVFDFVQGAAGGLGDGITDTTAGTLVGGDK